MATEDNIEREKTGLIWIHHPVYGKHLLSHLVQSLRLSSDIISIVFLFRVGYGKLCISLSCRPGSGVTPSFSRHHVSAVVSFCKTACLPPGGISAPSRPSMIPAGSESVNSTGVMIPTGQGMNKYKSVCVCVYDPACIERLLKVQVASNGPNGTTSVVRVGHDQQVICTGMPTTHSYPLSV